MYIIIIEDSIEIVNRQTNAWPRFLLRFHLWFYLLYCLFIIATNMIIDHSLWYKFYCRDVTQKDSKQILSYFWVIRDQSELSDHTFYITTGSFYLIKKAKLFVFKSLSWRKKVAQNWVQKMIGQPFLPFSFLNNSFARYSIVL